MATCYAKELQATTVESNYSSTPHPDWSQCWVQGSNQYLYRAYLQYDLSNIPYKSTIHSAKLRLYENWKNNNGDNGTTNIARVTEEWSEDTHCWNNAADSEGLYLTESVSPPGVGNWTDWDITTLVQEWVDQAHPNYGLMIVNNNEGSYRVDWKFHNRRYNAGEFASYIEIEYEPEPEYRITRARMNDIAEQVRRLFGTSESLTASQMVTLLSTLSTAAE